MKLCDILKNNPRTYSFEFFPPKDEISAVDFGINVGRLMRLHPSFVSVTYGAGGSSQERTFGLVNYLHNKIGLQTVAHYSCVGASKEKVAADMLLIKNMGIENLMVLRGDPPKGATAFVPQPNGFGHASELMQYIRNNHFDFCMGGGAYPEKHPEAETMDDDIANLKKKVEAGASFLLTQLFFINEYYFSFIKKCEAVGINLPIIPGILPITTTSQWKRFSTIGNVPEALSEQIRHYENEPKKIYQIGMDYAIAQCTELLERGAPGLHFYTLNKSRATVEIFETIKR